MKKIIVFIALILLVGCAPKQIELKNESKTFELGKVLYASNFREMLSSELKSDLKFDVKGKLEKDKKYYPVGEYKCVLSADGYEDKEITIKIEDTTSPKVQMYKHDVEVNYDGKVEELLMIEDFSTFTSNVNKKDLDFTKAGSYEIEVSAKDKYNNETKETFTINVHDYDAEKKAAEEEKAKKEQEALNGEYEGILSSELDDQPDYIGLNLTLEDGFNRNRSDLQEYAKKVYEFYDKKYGLSQYLINPSQGKYLAFMAADDDDGNPVWLVYTDEYDNVTDLTVFNEDYTTKSQTRFTYPGSSASSANDGKSKKEILSEKFDSADAWAVFELYGDKMYPYGFDAHYFLGKIAEEAADENTWFLKCEVTIKEAGGIKRNTVVEAKISGTLENPSIDHWHEY